MALDSIEKQLEKQETQVNEMRGALTHVQIALGTVTSLEKTLIQFMERFDNVSASNTRSLERIHGRIDEIQKEVSNEIDAMRTEVREMHDSHKESVSQHISTALTIITGQVQELDRRSLNTKEKLDIELAKVEGMAKMAKILWTVLGAGVLALGTFVIKLYATLQGV